MKDTMKGQKGITLIALIITIIVMLILVVVTINMAVNGGLFANAKEGADKTQREADKELLISATLEAMKDDGSIDMSRLPTIADGLGFNYSNGEYVKRDTLNRFTVSSDGLKIQWIGNGTPVNPWPGRGLATSNVVFDKAYHTDVEDVPDMVFYSDGGVSMGDTVDSDTVDSIMNTIDGFFLGSDWFAYLGDDDNDGVIDDTEYWYMIVFDGPGTATMYRALTTEVGSTPTKTAMFDENTSVQSLTTLTVISGN